MKKIHVFLLIFPVLWACADVHMPNLFSDHMLLQRGLAVPVWGTAEPGEEILVRFASQEKKTTADAAGKWMLRLDPLVASAEGRTLEVLSRNSLAFQDVLVGDVWLCSGQSNMEWPLNKTLTGAVDIEQSDAPSIRLFNVPAHVTANSPQPQVAGNWQVCSPLTTPDFSAVGYYFGRTLHRESGVPIGLIGSNWGGTRIEPWTPAEGFALVPELKDFADLLANANPATPSGNENWSAYLDKMADWLQAARQAVENKQAVQDLPVSPALTRHTEPAAIHHAMIAPLIPYGIRGAIWYQGEGNGGEGVSYFHKLQALIGGWRALWNQGDFPMYFYIVQLANFQKDNGMPAGGDGWSNLRDAQTRALSLPDTGMAVTIDIGTANDIHPRNKQDVGARLALWALRDVYQQDVVVSGPLFQSISVEPGAIRIHYQHVGGGLMAGAKQEPLLVQPTPEAPLKRFALAGEDKVWVWADARIDGDTVLVSSPAIPQPVAVRYAWSMNPEGANLYNREGLPAVPFRSDDW